MKNQLLLLLFMFISFFSLASTANAASQCEPIYGGGQSCTTTDTITLNLTIKNPQTGQFVDNLGSNDSKFLPNQAITVQVTIKNISNGVLTNAQVKNIFPQYVNYGNNGVFTTTIGQIKPNETKTFTIMGNIVAANNLPQGSGVVCAVDQATATVQDKTSQDNAQFCIQTTGQSAATGNNGQNQNQSQQNQNQTNGGQPVFPAPTNAKKTPPTGADPLSLLMLMPMGAAGLAFQKISSKISTFKKS